MAELDQLPLDEALKVFRGAAPTDRPGELPASVAPQTRDALLQMSDQLNKNIDPFLLSESRRLGARPGVAFDATGGASAGTRIQLGLDSNQLNQLKFLNQKYGPENVAINQDGRFILRNQPTDSPGKIQDVLIDPMGFDLGDIDESIAAKAPELIAGALGAIAGGKAVPAAGIKKVLAAAGGMALAQEGVGAVQDAIVRGYRDDAVEPGSIAFHRGMQALADVGLGVAAAGAGKLATKALPSVAEFLGIAKTPSTPAKVAQIRLRDQTGVTYPLSPAEESSRSFMQTAETMASQRVGFKGTMDEIAASKRAAEDELRRVFLGLPRKMPDDQLATMLPPRDFVGQRALGRLRQETGRLEGHVATATEAVQQAGTVEANTIAGTTVPLNKTAVGDAARAKVKSELTDFEDAAETIYNNFFTNVATTARTVDGTEVANLAKAIEKKFSPYAEKTTTKTVITNPIFGTTATVSKTSLERLDAFVTDKMKSFLSELEGMRGSKVGIEDLKKIRTRINNSIKEGIGIAGVEDASLIGLKQAVGDGIESALAKMPDPTLLNQWKALNANYATGKERFKFVKDMLIPEGEPGSWGSTEIAESVAGNRGATVDHYNRMKAFFGPASTEFKDLQQTIRQKVLEGSETLRERITGSTLISRLTALDKSVRRELFGTTIGDLDDIAKILEATKGTLDVAELEKLARTGSLTAARLRPLIAAEKARTVAYNNKLIAGAAKGSLNAEEIIPSEFVHKASQLDPDQLKKVMGILSDQPDLLTDIRRVTIEQIWGDAQALAKGQTQISSQLLKTVLGDETRARSWRQLIGNDAFQGLHSLIEVANAGKVGPANVMGGAIGGANDMAKIFVHGEVAALPALAARALIGFLYSGPLRNYATQILAHQDASRFLNGVIASEPFIQQVLEDYGSAKGAQIMGVLRQQIEPVQQKQLQVQGKLPVDPSKLTREEALQWFRNTAKQ